MHVVTKILVVFGAILAVVLSALTMAFAANADAISKGYRQAKADEVAAKAELSDKIAAAARESEAKSSQIEALNQKLSQSEQANATLENEKTRWAVAAEQAKVDKQSIENQVGQLQAAVAAQSALSAKLNDEVTSLRAGQLQSTKREIELVDRLNDLESQREVLEQNVRALQEQLSEAKLALELAQTGRTTAAASEVFEDRGPLIRARVTNLFKSPAGTDMAVISEGSNRGVKANMKMAIVRDNNFVANLIIESVDATQSVGRIDRVGRAVEIRADDVVMSRLD